MINMNKISFIENIANNVPWTKNIYIENIQSRYKPRPYSFMDQASEEFMKICHEAFVLKANTNENLEKIKAFLKEIEDGMQNENYDDIHSLIMVSFLENITPDLESFDCIRELMGYSSRAVLEYIHSEYSIY
jgi:hypothetical protein